MKVDVILADVGLQDSQGKLNLLGVGWSQISVGSNGLTGDMAVAILMEVPWDMCNREIDLTLELHTEDRQPVQINQGERAEPIRIAHKMVIPTPQGAPNGSPGHGNFMVRLQGGLPLSPGSWYCWRVFIDGEEQDDWSAKFFVRRQPTTPTFGAPSP